jgi:hypothetical protein
MKKAPDRLTSGKGPSESINPAQRVSIMGIGNLPLRASPRRATESFRMVPDRLWTNTGLQWFDIKLWCCLCFLARDRGWCDPTDDALAAETQASPQTVRRALHRLEQERFVARGMEGRARIIRLNPEGSGEPVPAYELKVVS